MLKKKMNEWWFAFYEIFNLKDEEAKGRTITLTSNILVGLYNIFITGIFYTGFLTMYGMSITDTGIITFIPLIANLFGVFSNKILGRFKRQKRVLLTAKMTYYLIYIIATTLMPLVVIDPQARMICFSVLVFLANAIYAPFLPGITAWMYHFYPEDNERRARYLVLLSMISSVFSSLLMLFSSMLTDMLQGSAYQNQLILTLRYAAFVLVLIEILVQSRAKEYPSQENPNLKFREVFTLSFKYPKFMACMAFLFAWSFAGNLGGGVWSYHMLNHLNFSYTTINIVNVLYTPVLLLLSPVWQKILGRLSWMRTLGLAILLVVPTEYAFFMMHPGNGWMYIPLCMIQHIMYVGISLAMGNVLYMNLPAENPTTHIVFNTIGGNIFALMGMATGTWISSWTGDETIYLFGMDMYSIQFTALLKGAMMTVMGAAALWRWRAFTSDKDIAEIEQKERMRKKCQQP